MYEEIIHLDQNIPIYMETVPYNKVRQVSYTHLHSEYEILYVIDGKMTCKTNNNSYEINSGDIMFLNSNTPHSTFNDTPHTPMVLLQFQKPYVADSSMRYIARFLNVLGEPAYLFKSGTKANKELRECILKIADEYENQPPVWSDFIYAHILLIISILRRNNVVSDSLREKVAEIDKIKPAIEYINENYNQKISTYELSRILNFNESYFCRLFKTIIGTNVLEYLNFVRVCKAQKLLNTEKSISDIAFETGFTSVSYFNRVFKNYNEYTPSEYRKILKHQHSEYNA